MLERAQAALEGGPSLSLTLPIRNADRAVGAFLSGEIARRRGHLGLPEGSIRLRLHGSAGQSFGAFLARGVTLELEGDANDYVGKGCSGGRIIVFPPRRSVFPPEENVIIGNTVLYGATAGELYVSGLAGERFAVRNSGAQAVVEGLGDHGCEYMTGGTVVVLGPTGRNFAAGMSGGEAFVLDEAGRFPGLCNPEMVELEPLVDQGEIRRVQHLVENHVRFTGSPLAQRVLARWTESVGRFVKVMPRDWKRVLAARRAGEATELESPARPRLRAVEA